MRKIFLLCFASVFFILSMTSQALAKQPECLEWQSILGTGGEGWHDETGLIKEGACRGQTVACRAIGTKSEGWYAMPSNTLIKYDRCGSSPVPTVTAEPEATPVVNPCQNIYPTLRYGWQGQEVRELQTILSRDKTIYPEGSVTGFFGEKTKTAVLKLQKQLGLSQTGEVDANLKPYIFPCQKELMVVYPNGGETFKVGETMQISWKVNQLFEVSAQPQTPPNGLRAMPPIAKYMFSVDLIEDTGGLYKCQMMLVYPGTEKCPSAIRTVFHIRNVNSDESSGSFGWKIPASIPESKNYKIRISSGIGNVCPPGAYCVEQSLPYQQVTDDSDGSFTILGGNVNSSPEPTSISTPVPTAIPNITEIQQIREEIAAMMVKIQELIKQLKELLGR